MDAADPALQPECTDVASHAHVRNNTRKPGLKKIKSFPELKRLDPEIKQNLVRLARRNRRQKIEYNVDITPRMRFVKWLVQTGRLGKG